jgi:cholesterol oxidase
MQHLDNQLAFKYGRSLFSPFRRSLKSVKVPGKEAPTYLPVANNAARILARQIEGVPLNVLMESMLNLSTTAHILGGCHMGSSPENGVIDTHHQVFGYPGLYVMSGASVSANIGANPSLTIAAMTERAVSLISAKEEGFAA